MPGPLLSMLLRGAMGAASGTTRIAAMAGQSGRGLIGGIASRPGSRIVAMQGARMMANRVDTPEMQLLRQRISAPNITAEQRRSDRGKLAAMLVNQRAERNRIRSQSKESAAGPFGNALQLLNGRMARLTLQTGGLTLAAAGATSGLARLARSSSEARIAQLRTISPQFASLAAKAEVAGLRRDAKFANLTAPSATSLSERSQRVLRETVEYKALAENILNLLAEMPLAMIEQIVRLMEQSGIGKLVEWANGWFGQQNAKPPRGHLLDELNAFLKNGATEHNRRPNEKRGGRM